MPNRLIDPHKIVPMKELPNGQLWVPSTQVILGSVAQSRRVYDGISRMTINDLTPRQREVLPGLAALVRRWSEIEFDEVCGHWIGTWTPNRVAEYLYLSVFIDGKSVNLGLHQAAWLAFRGRLRKPPTVTASPPGCRSTILCMVKSCGNPWHLEMVTAAENTRRARQAVQQLIFQRIGQDPLFKLVH